MKIKGASLNYKALYFSSLYYLIIGSISVFKFLYIFLNNLLTNGPAEEIYSYVYQLFLLIFLSLLIMVNYQIVFNEPRRSSLRFNAFFSAIQIIGFHIFQIGYLICFGLNFGILLGYIDKFEFQIVYDLFRTSSSINISDNLNYFFISINTIPLVILYIMLVNLKEMKRVNIKNG